MIQYFKTESIEERNAFIEECYKKNVPYTYHDKNKEGYYIVEVKD